MSKFLRLAILSAIGVVVSSSARADFTFDADGAGGQATAQTITGLQYAGGNALAVNAITPGVGLTVGTTFELLFQTNLDSLQGAPGGAPGLNTDYQITLVARITETVTSITTLPDGSTVATFELTPSANDAITLYFNDSVTFNQAAGTGFTDGIVIASLTPSSLNSFFRDTTATDGTQVFNQVGTGNGIGATTNTGNGSSTIGAGVNSYDSNFFQPPTGSPELISSMVNVGVNSVFDALPPSITFFDGTPALIGSNNGTSGPSFQLQTSGFVQSFTVVPEPASVAMTLLGLGGVGFGSLAARRRRVQASA